MASRLNPYLSFKDNARDALNFYKDVFGGELTISTFGDMGTEGPLAEKVMHGQLETTAGYTIMGADTPEEMPFTPGNTVTVSLSGDDSDALTGYWTALSDGGQVSMPLDKQMWGDTFGMCTDKFGTAWMVNIAGGSTSPGDDSAAADGPADQA